MDLICIKQDDDEADCGGYHTEVLYIQCKTNGKIGNTEFIELVEHSEKYGVKPVLAFKDKKGHIITESLQIS